MASSTPRLGWIGKSHIPSLSQNTFSLNITGLGSMGIGMATIVDPSEKSHGSKFIQ